MIYSNLKYNVFKDNQFFTSALFLHRRGKNDLNFCYGGRMIKLPIFSKPFLCFKFLIGVSESLVYELQIFSFALLTDKLMSLLKYWLIIQTQAKPKPTLLYLGIIRHGKIEISINARKNGLGDEVFVFAKFVKEDQFGCLGEVFEFVNISW